MARQTGHDPDFETLIEHIQKHRGTDFHGYKRTSMERRVRRRMDSLGLEEVAAYLTYLEEHPEEYTALIDTILINTTAFFRDPDVWRVIEERILPEIVRTRPAEQPIRMWSVGCASGEEPYTMAMLLLKALGENVYRRVVRIYATDVDDDALRFARHATYTAQALRTVPADLRERCFEEGDNGYTFRRDLRKMVVFGHHDIVNDVPISHIDLLVCRNMLIYLDLETQQKVLPRLHFALRPHGFLALGTAETQMQNSRLFTAVDARNRIFMRSDDHPAELPPSLTDPRSGAAAGQLRDLRLMQSFLSSTAEGHLLLDPDDTLVMADSVARRLFGLGESQIGTSFFELDISFRPVDLREPVRTATEERRAVHLDGPRWTPEGGEPQYLGIDVAPLYDEAGHHEGTAIHFYNVSYVHDLTERLQEAQDSLRSHIEELQSTNEELETTNEELQSAIEELETTNEELQSANEELETMNEELQSTNEELAAKNADFEQQTVELHAYQSFMERALGSMRLGVIVLDEGLRVTYWNDWSEELWGLGSREVSLQSIFALDMGLPAEALRPAIQQAMQSPESASTVDVEAINRRGQAMGCRIRCTPLLNEQQTVAGVVMLVEVTSPPLAHHLNSDAEEQDDSGGTES